METYRYYSSLHNAAIALTSAEDVDLDAAYELWQRNEIVHFWARDLPKDERLYEPSWQSRWGIQADDVRWFAVTNDGVRFGPFKKKREAMRCVGATKTKKVDDGVYEFDGGLLGKAHKLCYWLTPTDETDSLERSD